MQAVDQSTGLSGSSNLNSMTQKGFSSREIYPESIVIMQLEKRELMKGLVYYLLCVFRRMADLSISRVGGLSLCLRSSLESSFPIDVYSVLLFHEIFVN